MSFYSALTRNGVTTNRRIRKEIKRQEAVTRNALTLEHNRKDFRRHVLLKLKEIASKREITVTKL